MPSEWNEPEPAELFDSDWDLIRAWVGSVDVVSDEEILDRFARFRDVDKVIEESIRARLITLIEQPASMTTTDGTSMSIDANIGALRETLRMFISRGGARPDEKNIPGEVQIAKITRGHRFNSR